MGTSARTHLGSVVTNAEGKFTGRCIPGKQFVAQVIMLPEATILHPKPTQLLVQVPADAKSFELPDIEIREARMWRGKLVDVNNNPVAGKFVQPYFEKKASASPSRTTETGEFGFAIDKDITPDRWSAVLKWDLRDKSGNAGYANDKFEVEAKVVSEAPLILQIQMPEPAQVDRSKP